MKEKNKNLERIFAVHYRTLYKTAAIILCNEQDAYDAVQETFIKYLECKKNFKDEEHEKAWLLRVTMNICKNMMRFRRLHPTVEYREIELFYNDDKDYELMNVLFQMKQKMKEVLILRFIEGYSNGEIATILGISENAVKKRIERAKKEFKRKYEK